MSAADFAKISLNDKQVAECIKKPKLAAILKAVIDESTITTCSKVQGALLLSLAQTSSKEESLLQDHRAYIAKSINKGDISSTAQLDGAYHRNLANQSCNTLLLSNRKLGNRHRNV